MDKYIFKITAKNSQPSIWRILSVPVHYDFDHFHFLIQAAFDLSGIFDFQFVKGFHKPTDDTLRYDSGELSFEIKLMGLKGSDFPYAHLEDGEGKILCEMCGGIYGQLMVQEALAKYPNEPIAQYARKMLKKKRNAKIDFSFTYKDLNDCNRTIHKFEIASMLIPKDDWDDYDSSEMGFVSDDEYLDIINERVRNQQIGLDKDLLN